MSLAVVEPYVASISKTLIANPCSRKGWYSEHVRDADGHKLHWAMPEKVHFGAAVDSAHLELVWAASTGKPLDAKLAIEKGMERAKRGKWDKPAEWDLFEAQLINAITLFVDEERNDAQRRTAKNLAIGKPNGLARIPLEGIRFQGIDGNRLEADDVVGLPDYMYADGSVLDVKTSARRYSLDSFWKKAEMGVYALLATAQEGVLPPRLAYQVYVRVTKPYWDYLEMPGLASLVSLGNAHATHWRALLTSPVELASWDTSYCGDCGFREAIPEVDHEGCAIGQSIPVAEVLEEAA